jgi:hypothetical protein
VTPQSDLYSLGIMLYELVTGRLPFVSDDPWAVVTQHLETPPVAPSWHSEHCPPDLEALILHLLQKVPEDRPESASEVLAALERIDPEAASASHSDSGANPLDRLAQGVFVGRQAGGARAAAQCVRPGVRGQRQHRDADRRAGQREDTYLDGARDLRPTLRPRTVQGYEINVQRHLLPKLGRIRLVRLSPSAVQALLNRKVEAGLSPSTVRGIHATLRTALGQAERWGLVARNVAKLVTPPRVSRSEVHPFTSEEARRFLDAVKGDRFEVLYQVSLALGLRQGEALSPSEQRQPGQFPTEIVGGASRVTRRFL